MSLPDFPFWLQCAAGVFVLEIHAVALKTQQNGGS